MTIKPLVCPHCKRVIGDAHGIEMRPMLKQHIKQEHDDVYIDLVSRAKVLKKLNEEFSKMTEFTNYHFYLM